LTHPLHVAFWCPEPYRAALEDALAPLADRIVAGIHPEEAVSAGLSAALAADRPCVVFWRGLADHLTDHLTRTSGTGPDGKSREGAGDVLPVAMALAAWQERAEGLLTAFAGARHRLTLVPATALTAPPETLAEVLAERLDLPAGPFAAPVARIAAPIPPAGVSSAGVSSIGVSSIGVLPPGQSAPAALMAAAVLQTAPAAIRLMGRLEAASLPVPGQENPAAGQGGAGLTALLAGPGPEAGAVADLRADLARRTAEADLIREALAAQEDSLARQRTLAAEAGAARDRLTAERDDLATRLTRQQDTARRLAEDLATAEAALARATAAGQAQDDTARRLQERLTQFEAERAALEAAITTLETGQAGFEAQIRSLTGELAAQATEARQRADLIRRQRADLQAEADRRIAAEAARDALLASTSWRMTAPVRRVVLALRRLRGVG